MSRERARQNALPSLRLALLYTPLTKVGGAERQFLEEVRSLSALGHDVSVLTFDLAEEALFVDGIDVETIALLRGRSPLEKIVELRRTLAQLRPSLLVSHTSPELTWLATRRSGIPYVVYHNNPPYGPEAAPYMASRRYRRLFPEVRDSVAGYADFNRLPRIGVRKRAAVEARTALKHAALRGARAVIVPSQRTRRELGLLHEVEPIVVRGCVPAALVNGPAIGAETPRRDRMGKSVVLSVCRLEPVKRVDLLLRAFAAVGDEFPDATLVVGGTGPEHERLATLAVALGLGERVHFLGFVPERDLSNIYATADVFASPAMADFNIAPYEALAAGCKVVWTTEMETAPELEASGRIFVAEPEDAAFARALATALRARAGRQPDLATLTWEARARTIDAIYRSAAA